MKDKFSLNTQKKVKKQHTKHLGNRLLNSLSFSSYLGELDHVSWLCGFSLLAFTLQGIPENSVINTQGDSNSRLISDKTYLKIRQLHQLKYLQRYYFTQCLKSNIFVNIYILQCACMYFSLSDPLPMGPRLKYFLANSSISYLASCSTVSSSSPSLKPSKGTL